MNIREACDHVLGAKASRRIIADMGLHWAAVAAMAGCMESDGPECAAAIRAYFAELKRENAAPKPTAHPM